MLKVKWHYHLVKKDPDRLQTLTRAVDNGKEVLTVIHASFVQVIKACRIYTTDRVAREAALCTVNSVEYGKKVQDPFYMDIKKDTRSKYQTVWLQILSYIVRCETDWVADDRPGYRLTRHQRQAFDTLMTQAAAFYRVEVTDKMSSRATKQMTELDWQCLQFCIQLLDHRLHRDAYENVIISGLSILGIREGGGWLKATEYTTNYSAIVKLARALVVEHTYQTRQRQIQAAQVLGISEDEARESSESHYTLVRRMVDRFMGLEGGRHEPNPMDRIISKRAYGMQVRFTTTADGTVQWKGDTIIYKKIEFSMMQLQTMIQGVPRSQRNQEVLLAFQNLP